MEVLINNEQTDYDIAGYDELITKGFQIAARLENLQGELEISVSFVDNVYMKKLNRDYRGLDVSTDVLSFPQDDADGFSLPMGVRILGDIVISLEQAYEQAREYGHGIDREVAYLAVHGFFHLLGYNHETPEEQRVMRKLEEIVLQELDLRRE